MTVLTAAERLRSQRILPVLEDTIDNLDRAYIDLLTERVIDVFGMAYVDDDEVASLQGEAVFVDIRRVMGHLAARAAKARSDLADDGTNPPF